MFQFPNGSIKRWSGYIGIIRPIMFQFPNGSIKSRAVKQYQIGLLVFQFPNGSIKSASFRHLLVLCIGFNSLMVRLKAQVIL